MNRIFLLIVALFSSFVWASAEVGQKAPNFALQGSDGKIHKLSDLKGKIVVLEWFNTGCPYVRRHYESGNMQHLQKQFTSEGVKWFTVASSAKGKQGYIRDAHEAHNMYLKRSMNSSALLIDSESKVAKEYQAKTTPHMFVIDQKGLIAYNGAIDSASTARSIQLQEYLKDNSIKHYLEDAVNAVRVGQKVAIASTDPYGCSVKYP